MVTSDAHKALFGCNHLGGISRCRVAPCIPFPFSTSCDDMLTMLVCATRWLFMHHYMFAYMSMHESCLLVCRPCFNTMKIWTPDPNLHLSPVDITFCLPFACLSSYFLACSCILWLTMSLVICYAMLAMSIMLFCFMPLSHALCIFFLPLLVCWFLVLAFTCTHTERGRMELRHGLPGTSKKGEGTSLSI